MRLRNVKGSIQTIETSEFTINKPELNKGKWHEVFGNDHPIHIEVGMGKGRFITDLALLHPEINYIGIEKFSSVLVRAVQKRNELDISNLFFIRMDAENLGNVFENSEIDKIYLNFSDPWPKDRHAKRRLTSKEFFLRYDNILIPDGVVEFKTDNTLLFDFTLEQIPLAGWEISEYTYDLHNSPMNDGNVMTEYEEKFSSKGNPIHKLLTYRDK